MTSTTTRRRRCVDFEDTKAHDRHVGSRGEYVGDSPRMTRFRKTRTVRRERREGRAEIRHTAAW